MSEKLEILLKCLPDSPFKEQLRSELAALKVENEALRKDAARLDWVEHQDFDDLSFTVLVDQPNDGMTAVSIGAGWHLGNNLRAAIDVAMIAAAPQPEPVESEPVGHVYRYGKDSHGREWHGIHWYDPNIDVATGTKLYTTPQPDRVAELEAALREAKEALSCLYLEFERTREWGCLPMEMVRAKATITTINAALGNE